MQSSDEMSPPARSDAPGRLEAVLERVAWMRAERVWPAGARDLCADAFGLVLLVSLHGATGAAERLVEARQLVMAVERWLRPESEPFVPLALWVFALGRLARVEPRYRRRAVELARAAHARLGADQAHGSHATQPFYAYVALRSLEEPALDGEVRDLATRIERGYRDLVVTQDFELGLMLWLTHFHPAEPWARLHWARCQRILEHLWVEPPGYFRRQPGPGLARSAVANHAISIGLQSVGATPERVERLRKHFAAPRLDAAEDRDATAHVLACCADYPGELLCARGDS